MADLIRYGIIGSGMMGCEHILNIGLMPDAQVTAIADPSASSGGWGTSRAGDSVEVRDPSLPSRLRRKLGRRASRLDLLRTPGSQGRHSSWRKGSGQRRRRERSP
jgi:hypothetical protein